MRHTRKNWMNEYARIVHTPQEAATLVASGCGCDELSSNEPAAFAVDTEAPVGRVTWSGVLTMEGVTTGDGRLIEDNALEWDLPAPLRYADVDNGGHDGAQVVGRILTIERKPDGKIHGTGDFDMSAPMGPEAARVVKEKTSNGVSVDLDSVSFEIRVKEDLLRGGDPMDDEMSDDGLPAADEDGMVTVMEMDKDDELFVTTSARVRAATIVAIPAFAEAFITLDDEDADLSPDDVALVAGSSPIDPPKEWFDQPPFDGPTPLTIDDTGRVYGHLAVWGTCHVGFSGQCVEPPHSSTDYAYFKTGVCRTDDGSDVPVGTITLDTMHAGRNLGPADTLAHYEHTGKAVVDVNAGEDAYGIWVAGALRPGVPDSKVRALRAAPLSGDWRRIGGNLELVAALAVNSPGFPVPRPQGLVASGQMLALVASGVVEKAPEYQTAALQGVDSEALNEVLEFVREQKRVALAARRKKADSLAARVRADRAEAIARRVG